MSIELFFDEKLKEYVRQENARRLLAASKKITQTDESQAKEYLTKERKIPISTLEMSHIRSLDKEVDILEYNEEIGKITSTKKMFNCTITQVNGYDGSLMGVQMVHLKDGKKATQDNTCKEYMGAQPENGGGNVAVIQSSLDTTKVYIAEGIETAASICGISSIYGKYNVLASLGVDQLPKIINYLKTHFPPNCTIVLLKDHDVSKPYKEDKDANDSFEEAFKLLGEAGFQVKVKQPKIPYDDWNDVLTRGEMRLTRIPGELWQDMTTKSKFSPSVVKQYFDEINKMMDTDINSQKNSKRLIALVNLLAGERDKLQNFAPQHEAVQLLNDYIAELNNMSSEFSKESNEFKNVMNKIKKLHVDVTDVIEKEETYDNLYKGGAHYLNIEDEFRSTPSYRRDMPTDDVVGLESNQPLTEVFQSIKDSLFFNEQVSKKVNQLNNVAKMSGEQETYTAKIRSDYETDRLAIECLRGIEELSSEKYKAELGTESGKKIASLLKEIQESMNLFDPHSKDKSEMYKNKIIESLDNLIKKFPEKKPLLESASSEEGKKPNPDSFDALVNKMQNNIEKLKLAVETEHKPDVSSLKQKKINFEQLQRSQKKMVLLLTDAYGIKFPPLSEGKVSGFNELNQDYKDKSEIQESMITVLNAMFTFALSKFRGAYRDNQSSDLSEKMRGISTTLESDKVENIDPKLNKIQELVQLDESKLILALRELKKEELIQLADEFISLSDSEASLSKISFGINNPLMKRMLDFLGDKQAQETMKIDNLNGLISSQLSDYKNKLVEGIKIEDDLSGLLRKVSAEIDAAVDIMQLTNDQIKAAIIALLDEIEEYNQHSDHTDKAEAIYLKALSLSEKLLPGMDSKNNLQQWLNEMLNVYHIGNSLKYPQWPLTPHTFSGKNVNLVIGDVDEEKVLIDLTLEILHRAGIDDVIDSSGNVEKQKEIDEMVQYAIGVAANLYKTFKVTIPGTDNQEQEFDGVILKDGQPTVVERKANDGTGLRELQRNFIVSKLRDKLKFYERVDEARSKNLDLKVEKQVIGKSPENDGIEGSKKTSNKESSSNSFVLEEGDFNMFEEESFDASNGTDVIEKSGEKTSIDSKLNDEIEQQKKLESEVLPKNDQVIPIFGEVPGGNIMPPNELNVSNQLELVDKDPMENNPSKLEFEIHLDPPNQTEDKKFEKLMLAAKRIANDAIIKKRIELTLNIPDDPNLHETISTVHYPEHALGEVSVRLSKEKKGNETISNQKTDLAKTSLERKAATSEFKQELHDYYKFRLQGISVPEPGLGTKKQVAVLDKSQKKEVVPTPLTENPLLMRFQQKLKQSNTTTKSAREKESNEKSPKETTPQKSPDISKSKDVRVPRQHVDVENDNLLTHQKEFNYQLQSHDINYVGQYLINDSYLPINTVFLDVQQNHFNNFTIALQNALVQNGGFVETALTRKQNIVSAFNKDANHWTAYLIVPDPASENKLHIIYKDSYGNPPTAEFKEAFKALSAKGYDIEYYYDDSKEQEDSVSCGLFSLKNMDILSHLSSKVLQNIILSSEITTSGDKKFKLVEPSFFRPKSKEELLKAREDFAKIYDEKSKEILRQSESLRSFVDQFKKNAMENAFIINNFLCILNKDDKLYLKDWGARTEQGNTKNFFYDFEFYDIHQLNNVASLLGSFGIPHDIVNTHLQLTPIHLEKAVYVLRRPIDEIRLLLINSKHDQFLRKIDELARKQVSEKEIDKWSSLHKNSKEEDKPVLENEQIENNTVNTSEENTGRKGTFNG